MSKVLSQFFLLVISFVVLFFLVTTTTTAKMFIHAQQCNVQMQKTSSTIESSGIVNLLPDNNNNQQSSSYQFVWLTAFNLDRSCSGSKKQNPVSATKFDVSLVRVGGSSYTQKEVIWESANVPSLLLSSSSSTTDSSGTISLSSLTFSRPNINKLGIDLLSSSSTSNVLQSDEKVIVANLLRSLSFQVSAAKPKTNNPMHSSSMSTSNTFALVITSTSSSTTSILAQPCPITYVGLDEKCQDEQQTTTTTPAPRTITPTPAASPSPSPTGNNNSKNSDDMSNVLTFMAISVLLFVLVSMYMEDSKRKGHHQNTTGGGGDDDNGGGDDKKKKLKILGKDKGMLEYVKDRPGHDRRYAIDAAKIKRELGWTPKYQFDQALEATIDWYKENVSWWKRLKGESFQKYYQKQYVIR